MQWRNSSRNYGLTSILLHWGVALTVVGLFARPGRGSGWSEDNPDYVPDAPPAWARVVEIG